jgi:hypothetical protein
MPTTLDNIRGNWQLIPPKEFNLKTSPVDHPLNWYWLNEISAVEHGMVFVKHVWPSELAKEHGTGGRDRHPLEKVIVSAPGGGTSLKYLGRGAYKAGSRSAEHAAIGWQISPYPPTFLESDGSGICLRGPGEMTKHRDENAYTVFQMKPNLKNSKKDHAWDVLIGCLGLRTPKGTQTSALGNDHVDTAVHPNPSQGCYNAGYNDLRIKANGLDLFYQQMVGSFAGSGMRVVKTGYGNSTLFQGVAGVLFLGLPSRINQAIPDNIIGKSSDNKMIDYIFGRRSGYAFMKMTHICSALVATALQTWMVKEQGGDVGRVMSDPSKADPRMLETALLQGKYAGFERVGRCGTWNHYKPASGWTTIDEAKMQR